MFENQQIYFLQTYKNFLLGLAMDWACCPEYEMCQNIEIWITPGRRSWWMKLDLFILHHEWFYFNFNSLPFFVWYSFTAPFWNIVLSYCRGEFFWEHFWLNWIKISLLPSWQSHISDLISHNICWTDKGETGLAPTEMTELVEKKNRDLLDARSLSGVGSHNSSQSHSSQTLPRTHDPQIELSEEWTANFRNAWWVMFRHCQLWRVT